VYAVAGGVTVEPGDLVALVVLAAISIWYFRAMVMGPPPVRWTRSWLRLLWRMITYRR
jgi:hypothetical protein